jgi:hypothetical protein
MRNVWDFLTQRLHQDAGMKELIERFYKSVLLSEPVPIPYREILLTARIMDEIFARIFSDDNSEGERMATPLAK